MATPVILVTGHEGTAAVTADLLGLLTDHGTATLRSVAPGSVRRADPRPRCHRREQRRRHRASMKSAIHPDHHPRRLPRCPVLRRDQVVLEMIVITMVGRPSGPGERKWDVWGSVARAVTGGHVPVKSILTGAHADPHSYQASPADAAAIVDASVGTVFAARPARLSARRFWVRYAAEATGALTLDAGAVRAVVRQRRSLLAAGITAVSGRFCGGDVVELRAPDAAMVARGVVAYDASELATMVGRSTSELPGELRRPVVHADDLVAVSAKQAKQV